MDITKSDIIKLFRTLEKNGILEQELEGELEKHIKQFEDEMFDSSIATIETHFNDLLLLEQMNMNSKSFDYHKISRFSSNILQAMKFKKFSIVELLVKLKLIYSDLLATARLEKQQDFPLYYEKTSTERLQPIEAEQKEFLNELMNAPLDDIGNYLENQGYQFEHYYTTDTLDELVYRISHHDSKTLIDPTDILDELCILIMKPIARKYAPMTGIELIENIDNQYHSNETYKYRLLLERFVQTNPQPQFTFANFFQIVEIKPVFDSKQEALFGNLFTIYCQKLLGIDQQRCFLRKQDLPKLRPRQRRKINERITGTANKEKISQTSRMDKYSLNSPLQATDYYYSGYPTPYSRSKYAGLGAQQREKTSVKRPISTFTYINNQRTGKQQRKRQNDEIY